MAIDNISGTYNPISSNPNSHSLDPEEKLKVQNSQLNHQNNQVQQKKINNKQNIEFSVSGQALNAAIDFGLQQAKEIPEVNMELVNTIKAKIDSGELNVFKDPLGSAVKIAQQLQSLEELSYKEQDLYTIQQRLSHKLANAENLANNILKLNSTLESKPDA